MDALNSSPDIPRRSLKRKYPPLGTRDTVFLVPGKTLEMISAHGKGECYEDADILKVHEPLKARMKKRQGLDIEYGNSGKATLQQQATRGCTVAAAAMLILDHGGDVNPLALAGSNLGNSDKICKQIREADLEPVCTEVKGGKGRLVRLRKLIEANGSAILNVNAGIGGHVVVLDSIASDKTYVTLRDPYHGWEIDVKIAAFLKSWRGGDCIQVAAQ